ncbi:hypothetical protein HGRIS_002064 [Hohenbuehelia grisea]|uniref:Uncharacterized protein n=1 Tax=Hohenbuehelia grisea TaxID=104357 RepID=A0ABR3JKH7_9AGAR
MKQARDAQAKAVQKKYGEDGDAETGVDYCLLLDIRFVRFVRIKEMQANHVAIGALVPSAISNV